MGVSATNYTFHEQFATSPAFTEVLTYDYNLGKPLTYKDVNQHITNYAYPSTDLLDRLGTITRPDNSTTTFGYVDTPGSLSVTTKVDQISPGDQLIQGTINYDGLGRKTQSIQQEGGGCGIGKVTRPVTQNPNITVKKLPNQ